MSDFYSILESEANATYDDLKKRYQELVLRYHPDKLQGTLDSPNSRDHFVKINEAWNTLRNAEKRKQYDALLLSQQCSGSLIYATVSWSELCQTNDECTYPCRCGSLYVISSEEQNAKEELFVNCTECSLALLIKPNV